MNKYLVVGVTFAAIFAAFYYQKVVTYKDKITYNFGRIRVNAPSFQNLNWLEKIQKLSAIAQSGLPLTVTMLVTNNNSEPLDIHSFKGNLRYKDALLSEVEIPSKVVLVNGKTVEMPLNFTVKGAEVVAYFTQVIASRKELQTPIVVTGNLATSMGATPINVEFFALDYL
jgi:hypothetical protein